MKQKLVTFLVPSCAHIRPSVGLKHHVASPSHECVYAADLRDAFQPAYITTASLYQLSTMNTNIANVTKSFNACLQTTPTNSAHYRASVD